MLFLVKSLQEDIMMMMMMLATALFVTVAVAAVMFSSDEGNAQASDSRSCLDVQA
jgi:hypothetical protein